MKRCITLGLLLILFGCVLFFAMHDQGESSPPHLFDNMNERPLIDAQQVMDSYLPVGRMERLRPPHAVAQFMGGNSYEREQDRLDEAFATDSSYFLSGRMQGGEEDSMPLELGGISRRRDVQTEGRFLYSAHCAVCHGVTGNGQGRMVAYADYPQIDSFRDEKYASYSPGKMFRSIRSGQGNMPAFGNILTARDIWCLVTYIRDLQSHTGGEPITQEER